MSSQDGDFFNPAIVDGNINVFGVQNFIFCKPRWVEDKDVITCFKCTSKFTQLRRRHHCRQCGRVFCNKCCYDKVALPHLGCAASERVCESCKPIAALMSKAWSSNLSSRLDAAEGIATYARNPHTILQVVELGGLQTLVSLASENDEKLQAAVADGLHCLSRNVGLHQILADSGALNALSSMIRSAEEDCIRLLSESASALRVFCKSPQLRQKAVSDGGIDAVMKLCSNSDDTIALLGVSTLSLIVEDSSTHNAVVFHSSSALSKVLELTASFDEQMQEVALRTLCLLSLGSRENSGRIWQLDISCGHYLLSALQSHPENIQILKDVTCLMANIADSGCIQGSHSGLVSTLVKLLAEYESIPELSTHAIRGLANLANSSAKSEHLVGHLPNVINLGLHSQHATVRSQSVRFITNLLINNAGKAITLLSREGAVNYLRELIDIPSLMKTISNHLQKSAPSIAKPI